MDNEVVERLTRIETKLDAALTIQADHEKRIRSGEKQQWLHSGGVAAFAFLLAKMKLGITS
jgi:hypothetical protein